MTLSLEQAAYLKALIEEFVHVYVRHVDRLKVPVDRKKKMKKSVVGVYQPIARELETIVPKTLKKEEQRYEKSALRTVTSVLAEKATAA